MPAPATRSDSAELIRFILTRLDDEDDDHKRRARALRGGGDEGEALRIERARTETLSRRQIVGSVQQLLILRDLPNEKAVRDVGVQILRSLVTPYADHTGFRDEWHAGTR